MSLILSITVSLLIVIGLLLVANWFVWIRPKPKRYGFYQFNDGKSMRSIDPINLLLSLEADKELLLYRHPKQAREGNTQAIKICVNAIQKSFGVVPYLHPKLPGLTVSEMLDLLESFLVYCELQKKSTSDLPKSPVSMDATLEKSTELIMDSSSVSG
jgi:hypothetical protein